MSRMSSTNTSKAARSQVQRQRSNKPLALQKAAGTRKQRSRDQTGRFMISQELIADRLRCMLEHIRSCRTRQVLLHTIVIASALNPGFPNGQTVRDMVHEAQALFMRGNRRLAEQRLHDALNRLGNSQEQTLRVGLSHLRSRTARA